MKKTIALLLLLSLLLSLLSSCQGTAPMSSSPASMEAAQWINAVITDTDPCVLPEQAFTVTRILEGIYESAKTGKPYYFD